MSGVLVDAPFVDAWLPESTLLPPMHAAAWWMVTSGLYALLLESAHPTTLQSPESVFATAS
eukprot:6167956-Prymnesium_polylepis.1